MKFAVRLTDEQKARQQQRFDAAAALLHQKEATFHTEASAAEAAKALGLSGVCADYAAKALFDAKGNAEAVKKFLTAASDASQMELRAKLLHVLTVKDMTDLCAECTGAAHGFGSYAGQSAGRNLYFLCSLPSRRYRKADRMA